MNTIKGYCRTNMDGYSLEKWPREFVAIPREGDRVAAESGKTLKVCGVTHKYDKMNNCPYIEIELTNSRGGATL